MHNNGWSLIFFTLISQLSVGILLVFSFVFFLTPSFNEIQTIWWKSPELLIIFLLGVAGIISLLHLGNPLNATNSVNNFSGSWISKEIISLGIMLASVFVLFTVRWMFPTPIWLVKMIFIISSLAGLFLIYSMSRIYMIETIPSWNSWFTPVSFSSSIVLFFLLSLFVVEALGIGSWRVTIQVKSLLLILFVFLLIQIIITAFHQFSLSGMEALGIEKKSFTNGMYVGLFIVKMIIMFLSAIYLFYLYLNLEKMELNSILGISILLILIFQEFIGRFMFYQSYVRIGV